MRMKKSNIKGLVVQIFYVIMLFTMAFIIVVEQCQNTLSIIVFCIGTLILSVVIFYLWLKGGIISGKVGVYWLVWGFCVLNTFWQKRMDVTSMIFLGIPAVAVLLYPRWGQTLTMKRYYCRWSRFFLGLVSVYYSFALIGNELFMQETRMNLSIIRGSLFVLYTIALYPSIYAVVVLFEWLAKKARKLEPENDKRKVILAGGVCGIATGIVLFGCGYGFYPAAMSNDSIRHWSEALGTWNISDRSPIAFTLFIRFLPIMSSPKLLILQTFL